MVENHLNKLIDAILKNDDFKKYVHYLTDDPLAETIVPGDDEIMANNIVPHPFHPELLKKNVSVFINPVNMTFGSSAVGNTQFIFDIVVPAKSWLLPGRAQLRVFRIADEISKSIDQQRITGVNENIITNAKTYVLNREFFGLTMALPVTSNALKGLR